MTVAFNRFFARVGGLCAQSRNGLSPALAAVVASLSVVLLCALSTAPAFAQPKSKSSGTTASVPAAATTPATTPAAAPAAASASASASSATDPVQVGELSAVPVPSVAARAWITLDAVSGQVVASSNPDMKIEPASLTKIMTAYVAFNALKEKRLTLEQDVPVSQTAW